MSVEPKELFKRLLEQAELTDQDIPSPFFDQGELQKVKVIRAAKRWEFYLSFEALLPYAVYSHLQDGIQRAFQSIAHTRLFIKVEQPTLDEQTLQAYWREAVKQSNVTSPICDGPFQEGYPEIKNGKVIFYAENDVVKQVLSSQFLKPVADAYEAFGFSPFTIHAVVDEEASQKKLNEFKSRKEHEDEQEAIRMTENIEKAELKRKKQGDTLSVQGPVRIGRKIAPKEEPRQMNGILEEERSVVIEGFVFDAEVKDLRSGRQLLIFKMTDYTSSFSVKKFSNTPEDEAMFGKIKKGMWLRVRGSVQEDTFMRDLVVNAFDIMEWPHEVREDLAEDGQKRVELHAHTTMSQMDAPLNVTELVAQAAKWGHPAIAITDHAGVQSFPEAHQAGVKNNIKILYGVEAYIVDDGIPVAYNPQPLSLRDSTYVVFDVETTGLSAIYDRMIELSGVKMENGHIVDKFEEFIDPGHPLSQTTIHLTGITDEMVQGSKTEKDVVERFRAFSEGCIFVAHNAAFDMGFLNTAYRRHGLEEAANPVIDTLEMSRKLHPHLKTHRLNTLAKRYDVPLEQHHRAIYDAEATAYLYWLFMKEAEDEGMFLHEDLNNKTGTEESYKQARPFHATIYAETQAGLKNLFKLVSKSMVEYFYRVPRIPRSELTKLREGLLVGTACDQGEVFEAMMQKGKEAARQAAGFYDFIEVQPKAVYQPLIERELIKNDKHLEDILKNMVQLGEETSLPVVATGNVHYLNPEDAIYRSILLEAQGGGRPSRSLPPKVHFRTTDEMLEAFAFLGKEKAYEIVVANTQALANQIEEISPIKTKLYTPTIEGSEDEIKQLTYEEAYRIYGNPLPEIIEKRIVKELTSIIGNGFSVIYLISQKLVKKSLEAGYLVGSRGSVGSSFVATMTGITEVNPIAPHYVCPSCQYSEFFTDGSYGSGFDLPAKKCPNCQTELHRDGHDIPFETFLGFKGEKVPDIDLNFSGEFQAKAHDYTKVLFGEDKVFRAGTIGTIADRTAFGYVKGYEKDNSLHLRSAEIDRLAKGLTGVKRSTGQHPGGIIVIPDYMDVYDFTPIQFPADAQDSEWMTTHFDFHSIHDNVLKLDILGHDDPTVIKKLQDLSGIDPDTIPPNDPDTMKIFTGTEILGVTPEQIYSKTGTLGIPEFGTRFVRGMLEDTKPTTFSELLQISGLSHGTDVYMGNADILIRDQNIPLSDVIGCRDDIMVYLQHKGMEDVMAFRIMESVRKGKGLSDEWEAAMRQHQVPEWYIDSCLKIKYMFPKAHAAAYVMMALRVAYFKVHYPIYYYAAYFSIRAQDFELETMARGKEAIKLRMKEIMDKGLDATAKDKNVLTVLELANEMEERGFSIQMVDLYKSDASEFIIEGNSLIAPFRAVPSLGENVAKQIVEARMEKEFLSKEDLAKRGKASKTVIDYLDTNGVLKGLPDENQLSLFDLM